MLLGSPVPAELDVSDFVEPAHVALWGLVSCMAEAGEPVDLVTVPERVAASGEPMRYGGVPYVVELADHAPPSSSLPYYVRRLRALGAARRTILRLWDLEDAVRRGWGTEGATAAESDLVALVVGAGLDREGAARVFRAAGARLGWGAK
jgi:replicative DNA helicase